MLGRLMNDELQREKHPSHTIWLGVLNKITKNLTIVSILVEFEPDNITKLQSGI
jgi:hypothetical protein